MVRLNLIDCLLTGCVPRLSVWKKKKVGKKKSRNGSAKFDCLLTGCVPRLSAWKKKRVGKKKSRNGHSQA